MICPECGTRMEVVKTVALGAATARIVECPCGIRCETIETVARRLKPHEVRLPVAPPVDRRQPEATGSPTGRPPATKSLPVDRRQPPRGEGGGLVSGSDLSLTPIGDPDQTRPRVGAKKRGESPAFVAFYEAYPRREARPRAWAAWVAQGCEGIAEEVMRGVANWKPEHFRRAAKDPSTVPHPASWLNARQWQDAPPAPPAAKAKDTRCAFHLNWNNHHRKPPGGWYAECPECKEARAALGTRQGDPTPTVDALAATERKVRELRDAAGKTWTPDQLAEMRATRAQKIREPAEPRPPPLNAPSAASPAVHPGGSSVDGSGTPAGYPGVVSKGGS